MIRHAPILRLFALTLLTFVGIGPAFVAPAGEPEDRGKTLLTRLCAGCHAVGRTGESPHRGAPPFRTLGELYDIAELTDRMTDRLVSTHPDMPDFQFSEEDAKAIRSYLYSIQP